MTTKQIIIYTFLDTLGKICMYGYHQWSAVTTFERVIESQYSLPAPQWDKTSLDLLVCL